MTDKRFRIMLLIGSLIPILSFLFYLIGFYPGMMTVDSVDQWAQMVSRQFDDWHPVMHTLFNYLCTRIWYSPASVVVAQILILTSVFISGIYALYKAGVNKVLLVIMVIIFSIYPINGYMVVTLWKDVLYSIMLLWMTIIIISIVNTKGEWIDNWKNQILFALNVLGVLFFRHNGILTFLFVVLTLLAAFPRHFKKWVFLCIVTLGINFIVTGPVFKLMQVNEGPSTEAMGIPMQQIAAVVKSNGNMTEEQRNFISKILPMEVWREKYHPYITNPLKFDSAFNATFLMENKVEFVKQWFGIIKQNPEAAMEAYLKQTSMLWRVQPYPDSFTYTVTPGIIENDFGLKTITISPRATDYIMQIFDFTNKEEWFVLFWRPALWLYVALTAGIIIALRSNWKGLLVLGPLVSNTTAFFIATPSQDYRYQYANVLIAFMLLPLAIHLLINKKQKVSRKNLEENKTKM